MKTQSWSPSKTVWLAALLCLGPLGASAQSLWQQDDARSMFADKRAYAIGDILTIIVQENQTATKSNTTKTAKNSSVDASISSFLFSPEASGLLSHNGAMPSVGFGASNEFDGGGQIKNSEKITARIAVRVIDVLPNNQMVIEGRRETSFSGEEQDVVLRGLVRAEDVSPNNTVFSYNIADATINYVSKGTISDSQRKGWFTRIWDKVSPF